MNESGLRPKGRAVLVKPYEPEIAKSTIVIPDTVRERQSMIETRCTVIEIGPACWEDESGPRCKVGDKMLISRYAGVVAVGPKDNVQYRIVNDRDLFCQIED